jgi:hypothetical protein
MLATNILLAPPLPDINEIVQYSESDKPLFDELYDVLRRFDALDRFGISLLHSHFELKENEVLLEETDRLSRTQLIKPITEEELSTISYIETSWRLDVNGPQPEFRCQVEQTSVPPQHVDR